MDAAARAKLVERHLDIPIRAAKLIYPRVKDHLQLDELISLGNAGLAEAASRYEDDRGASFSTFAWYRVQGAIIDGLRRATPLPRRVWQKLVALRAAAEYLEQQGEAARGASQRGTPPPAGADALAAVQKSIAAIRTMYMTSLEGLEERGFDPSDDAPLPSEVLDGKQQGARLAAALARLPERERALMTMHYYEGKNLLEAGQALGISKSWASRLHAQAVDRLRRAIEHDD